MSVQEKLSEMIGKSWMYNARTFKILAIYTDNGTTSIATNKDLLKFKTEELPQKLNEFLPVEADETVGALVVLKETSKKIPNLTGLIMENIDGIKSKSVDIPSAKAINDSVKTIIELAKLEIEVHKLKNK